MEEQSESPLHVLSKQVVYQEQDGAHFTVTKVNTVVRSTGEAAQFHVVSTMGGAVGAVCIAISSDNRILIGKHWRVATEEFAWEFPRGMGEAQEKPQETALREFSEETGISVDYLPDIKMRHLQNIFADSGLLSGEIAVVEMRFAQKADEISSMLKGQGDWEFGDSLRWISCDELYQYMRQGEIKDGITLAAIALWESSHR